MRQTEQKGGEQDETVTVSTRDMEKPKAYAECNNTEIEISECAAATMVGTIEVKARYSGKRLEKEAIEQFSGILKKCVEEMKEFAEEL